MRRATGKILGSPFPLSFLLPIFFLFLSVPSNALQDDEWWERAMPLVRRADERRSLIETEHGEISAIDFSDGSRFGPYHLQFITLEPNSLFLPVLLHADMVFYIHTGSGRLSWIDDEDLREVDLRRGDIYRLHPGSIFYLQSSLESERHKLRIYALFSSTDDDSYEPAIGAYSSVADLVRGFNKKVLGEAFMAPKEVIEEIVNATKTQLIVHAVVPDDSKKPTPWELEARFLKAFIGDPGGVLHSKKKKQRIYNVYEADPDFENCNGWSVTVTRKDSHLLKGSNVGFFAVNLTAGSMMAPHWNPRAREIAIVTEGPGMVRVGCSSTAKKSKCKTGMFRVDEGDVIAVPRFYPMAQMSFNNGSFVFVGFSTTTRQNLPQFLAGKSSVLQNLDRKVLATSFDVNETTIDRLLAPQVDSVILECISCAEEEERMMEEEAEREREEEEERRRREEEAKREEERKREEEEAKREEERKREEEEAKREEERKREEEEAKREEERKREEEEAKREEERKREEEEAKREEERKREEEEEAASRKREEEERRKREEKEEAKREEERRREEEETRKREEEEWGREEEKVRRREEEREREEEEEEERERAEEEERREEETREQEEGRRREEEVEVEEGRGRETERERRGREAESEEEEAREREAAHQRERWKRHREAERKREEAEREEEEREARRGRGREEEEEEEEEQEEEQEEEDEERVPVVRILSQWT